MIIVTGSVRARPDALEEVLSVVTDSLALAEQIGAVEPLGPKVCELYDRGAGVA